MRILRSAVLSLALLLTGCVGYSYQPAGYGYSSYSTGYAGYSGGYVAPVVVGGAYGYRPAPYYGPAPYYRPAPVDRHEYHEHRGRQNVYRERYRG